MSLSHSKILKIVSQRFFLHFGPYSRLYQSPEKREKNINNISEAETKINFKRGC